MPVSTGKLREASPRAQCPKCKEVFSNVSNAEKHWRKKRPIWPRECLAPEKFGDAGLIMGKSGVWISDQDRFKDKEE